MYALLHVCTFLLKQVSLPDGVGELPVCPVEDGNAVVIDEM